MKSFQDLSLSDSLTRAIAAMGFKQPTPIQAQSIPLLLKGSDLIGCAQTGTGKTAAFSIPMVSRLEKEKHATALVLVPTREIALQIIKVIEQLVARLPALKPAVLIGGAAMSPQIRALSKKPRIVIATPGRLIDHLERRTIDLSRVGILVLDEADRMLDMGFAPQLNEILKRVPKERQTMLFSATMPADIQKLAHRILNHPERVTVGKISAPAKNIRQTIVHTDIPKKNEVLLDALNERNGSVLIFMRTKRRTDKLARFLSSYGHNVAHIHGDRSQAQRNAALQGFRSGQFRILVATDVAARGIDVPSIEHVINFDLPQNAEDYVHRIGRTARAGASGEALSILTPEDRSQWRAITKLVPEAKSSEPAARQ